MFTVPNENFWRCGEEKDESLFDTDSKESGFCEENYDLLFTPIESELDPDVEKEIVEFLPSPLSRKQFDRENGLQSTTKCEREPFGALNQNELVINRSINRGSTEVENKIKEAVEKSTNDVSLIGDFSKPCILPCLDRSEHADIKTINISTLKELLEGQYNRVVNSYEIIDCRYPYEYSGGHIKGAVNFYSKETCLNVLLQRPPKPPHERHIVIFHCEFSMERGPNMLRALREEDRLINAMNYPKLLYPEIYILAGGYKKFFRSYPNWCIPIGYKRMVHPQHVEDLRKFRKKSKSFHLSKSKEHESKLRKYYSEGNF